MTNPASLVIIVAVFVWAVYRRVKRTIGFQLYSRARFIRRIVIFSILGALTLAAGVFHPTLYIAIAIGAAVGGVLAYIAKRTVRFEQREGGLYYRTHVWVEIVVLVLFLGRLIYRFTEIFLHPQAQHNANPLSGLDDPLTGGALALFVCYYIAFAVTLLVGRHDQSAVADDADHRDMSRGGTGGG